MSKPGIFLVKRTDSIDYDEYDSFVVVAPSETAARHTHPSAREYTTWCADRKCWVCSIYNEPDRYNGWTNNLESLVITRVGDADVGVEGIICASFNAG